MKSFFNFDFKTYQCFLMTSMREIIA